MKKYVWILVVCVFLQGCGSSPRYTSKAVSPSRVEEEASVLIRGVKHTAIMTASYYGKDFHGRKTSSGEVFDMFKMTAAHKTLPLGTVLKVTYMKTGKSVVVKVNDRGPFIPGRDIDLSYGAALRIGLVEDGVGKVRVTVIKWGSER